MAAALIAARAAAALAPARAAGGKGKPRGEVRVATTGSYSERIERLPITPQAGRRAAGRDVARPGQAAAAAPAATGWSSPPRSR